MIAEKCFLAFSLISWTVVQTKARSFGPFVKSTGPVFYMDQDRIGPFSPQSERPGRVLAISTGTHSYCECRCRNQLRHQCGSHFQVPTIFQYWMLSTAFTIVCTATNSPRNSAVNEMLLIFKRRFGGTCHGLIVGAWEVRLLP